MTLPTSISGAIEAPVLGASPKALPVRCQGAAAGFCRVHLVAGGDDFFYARRPGRQGRHHESESMTETNAEMATLRI